MTFLSVTPDDFYAGASRTPVAAQAQPLRAPFLAHVAASLMFAAAVTVPGAVAQAKWNKLNLIFGVVQQRCMASFSA